jgi:prolyl-tRNA synthetase
MKWSKALIPTLKEDPADAEVISHKLMVRAGLIRKLGAGAYTYLPLGFKVLKKVEAIVREEMNRAGAEELLMPALHPRELWERTGRFSILGDILITYKDRHGKVGLLGPTHEEVITDLVAKEVRSYRDLPKTLYQIQTKFRDEPRPRFGVLRSKEFIMKDAYSFDADVEGLNKSYQAMYDAYCRIFDRCGLDYIVVEADTGFMGGDVSHEFMVPSESGEDIVAICSGCGYKASTLMAECPRPETVNRKPDTENPQPLQEVHTPGVSTVEKVSDFLKVEPYQLIKTLVYEADGKPVAVLVRGDHTLNETKLQRHLGCTALEMGNEALIKEVTGGPLGFSGPVGLGGIRIVADYGVGTMGNRVTGANKADTHLINVNSPRDFTVSEWADIREIAEGDMCPRCRKKTITLETTIEVGHTFKLGTKYSKDLGATFLDKDGKERLCIMGCYGIGVNRIIAATIEQHNDKDGIIWPPSLAPYQVITLPINVLDTTVRSAADRIYSALTKAGYEVLYDDRDERPGIKFKDADLIGIPLRVVVGEKNLKKGKVEVKPRNSDKTHLISAKEVPKEVKKILQS